MHGLLALIVALLSLLFAGAIVVESGDVTADAETAPQAVEAATPAADAAGPAITMTVVDRSEQVTDVDLGEPGPSPGDMIIWGPDPIYDETNTTDTGAVTSGMCVSINVAGDCLATETITFSDGSTLEIQGFEPGTETVSMRTIVGGSGIYLGATGTMIVDPAPDRSTWTKTLEIWLERGSHNE